MNNAYLHSCLELFAEVSKDRYGYPFDLEATEHDVQHLRTKRKISYKDLVYFTNPERWWFDRFWVLPVTTLRDPRNRTEVKSSKYGVFYKNRAYLQE